MYRYETHLHTKLTSACASFTTDEIVEKYTRLGYTGIFVTDHFLNGNTTVPRDLPWAERVARFCEGYRAVKRAAGDRLQVFFGLEYSYKGTDFLVYGLNGGWLLDHPEMMQLKTSEFCPFARGFGALVVQAHPFREANYIDHVRLFPSVVDGMETLNANRDERCNRLADNLANEYSLVKTAGSDIHQAVQNRLAGLQFSTPLVDENDFVRRVKAGEGSIFELQDQIT